LAWFNQETSSCFSQHRRESALPQLFPLPHCPLCPSTPSLPLSASLSRPFVLIIRWCAQWRARRGVGGSHGAM
jgi:hypothetical protein